MNRVKTSNRKIKHQLNIRDINKNSSNEVGHVITKIKTKELEMTIIWVIIILIVICIFLYITFSSVQKREKHNTLKVGTLLIDYSELDIGMGDVITLTNEAGVTDQEGISTEPYTFKITNKSNKTVKYEVILEDDTEMMEIDQCQSKSLEKENIRFSLDGKTAKSLSSIYQNKKYVLVSSTISAKSSKKYKLNVWIDSNESSKDKHYHGKIVVKNIKEKK